MKKSKGITAQLLKYILLSVLVLSLVAFGGAFYIAREAIGDLAKQTSSLNSEASISDDNLISLQKTKQYLSDHQSEVDRAARIVAESKQYQYQDEIITDLASFAQKSGVIITNYVFDSLQTGSKGSVANKPTQNTATVSGLKAITVQVTLKNPVNYTRLLKFISYIEQNTTKMQISNISLSRDTSEGVAKTDISSQSFSIIVYTR